jgi:hypothetical protein
VNRIQTLAQRRLELVERSAAQRASLLAAAAPLTDKAAAVDRLVAAARRHPVVTMLGAGAVALLASRRLFGFATRLLTLYALIRR